MSKDKPARIRASLLNIQNLVSISGPPSEDHNQASWHSVWNHSHYSDVTCKCGRRRCNLFFSLMPIGEGNVHQLPIDDVVMVLKNVCPVFDGLISLPLNTSCICSAQETHQGH